MSFDIGEIHPNTPHLFADLAELLLLTGFNGKKAIHKNDLEAVLLRGPISHEEIDDEEAETNLAKSGAERNVRSERQLEEVMMQLEYRSRALDTFYPFQIDGEELVILDELNEKHRIYFFLLACSRLRSFGREGLPQKWAKSFTKISKFAMTGLLPTHATVRIFDANSDDRKNYYTTDLRIALKTLGRDLSVLKINEDECGKAGPSGDAGLDLVAILNFEDGAANAFALLGQCGAQETGWPKKTLEAHSMRYRHFFQMQFDYPAVMFTPVCYRTVDGEWCNNQSTNGILLADRGRILKLLELQNQWKEIAESDWFITFEGELSTISAAE